MEEPITQNRFELDKKGELRSNLPELNKKRDEYIIQAIGELENKIPRNLITSDRIDYLTDIVIDILENKHKMKSSEDAIEFSDTYPKERVGELLRRHLEMNGN